jgi:hypothetical protein
VVVALALLAPGASFLPWHERLLHISVDIVNIVCPNVDRVNIERRFAQMSSLNRIATEVKRGWSDSAPLTATTFVMLVAFVASVAGILLDGRLITGVPAC